MTFEATHMGTLEVCDANPLIEYQRFRVKLRATPSCYETESGNKYRKSDGRASRNSRPRYRLRLDSIKTA